MITLSELPNQKFTFVLRPHNYTQLYNKLKTLLPYSAYSFFARPDIGSESNIWSLENSFDLNRSDILLYDELTDEEKDSVADYIEDKKKSILEVLKQNNELRGIAEQFFNIPSQDSIKVFKDEIGLSVVLTQWGCKSNEVNSEIDSLSTVISRPRITTSKVVVDFYYTDGTKAIDKIFYIENFSKESKLKTNKNGLYDLGRCKIGWNFKIYDKEDDTTCHLHEFTVNNDITYVVYFPLYTSGIVKLINQKDIPIVGSVLVQHNHKEIL
jgi:hypothetical protein